MEMHRLRAAPVANGGAAGAKVDIPLRDIANANIYLSVAFNTKVVFIGGRAVNLLCLHDSRPTHDIDIAIGHRPTPHDYAQLPKTPGNDGVYFELDRDPSEIRSRVKLLYHSPTVAKLPDGRMEIDIYYPGYLSSATGFKPKSDVNGISISDIVATSETVKVGSMEFNVVNPAMLVLMKYDTWLSRGKGDYNAKDFRDIANIVKNHFNNPTQFEEFKAAVMATERRYVHAKESEVGALLRELELSGVHRE
ncbi:MAG: nucleotidyl transferase AbiEii/AbiGii toxin family protein [Candidatus Micrarchaeota archaeon]|nr:nucleotidyl transferase AbiEii/AbiGii toxin family protein [Candidatus Micrarchaeota archaeon]